MNDAEKLDQLELLKTEADMIRSKDWNLVKTLLGNFYGQRLNVGIAFQRAGRAILSGDYFRLHPLPDGNYMFSFADLTGHGLPAYTNLIRLNSSLSLAIRESRITWAVKKIIDPQELIRSVSHMFTDLMEELGLDDFASALFTFIYYHEGHYYLKFISRGALFPMILRKESDGQAGVYDLNKEEKGWLPVRGHLLSSPVRNLLPKEFEQNPTCEFVIKEGDRVLFFSDGLAEAVDSEGRNEEFGEDRIRNHFLKSRNKTPQETVDDLFKEVLKYSGKKDDLHDDMTAILIDFPMIEEVEGL